jgi:hypothetical protein
METTSTTPVLRYPVPVGRLPDKGLMVTIEADARELAALAAAHGLLDVAGFRAELHLSPWKKRGVRVRGTVRAGITQSCVVTLDPLDSTIDERVDALFIPVDSRLARPGDEEQGELIIDPEGPDLPETFLGDTLDVGAIAEEFFELAIDPYPRSKGAALGAPKPGKREEPAPPRSPFASLADWKSKQ